MFMKSENKVLTTDEINRYFDSNDDKLFKSQTRRLYDVANVLKSLGLIEKIKYGADNKNAFRWIGHSGFILQTIPRHFQPEMVPVKDETPKVPAAEMDLKKMKQIQMQKTVQQLQRIYNSQMSSQAFGKRPFNSTTKPAESVIAADNIGGGNGSTPWKR